MKSLIQYISESPFGVAGHKYECLNRGTSMCGNLAKRFQGCGIGKSADKVLWSSVVNEGIDYEFEEGKRGGIIVFSTDVNAVKMSENKLVNWFKQRGARGTVGKYFFGRYTAKNGKAFGENSISLEIIGVESDELIKTAEEFCSEFQQECVLAKFYDTGKILLINPE